MIYVYPSTPTSRSKRGHEKFSRELFVIGDDLPLTYEGNTELFRTDLTKLLLARLRILEDDSDGG